MVRLMETGRIAEEERRIEVAVMSKKMMNGQKEDQMTEMPPGDNDRGTGGVIRKIKYPSWN